MLRQFYRLQDVVGRATAVPHTAAAERTVNVSINATVIRNRPVSFEPLPIVPGNQLHFTQLTIPETGPRSRYAHAIG